VTDICPHARVSLPMRDRLGNDFGIGHKTMAWKNFINYMVLLLIWFCFQTQCAEFQKSSINPGE